MSDTAPGGEPTTVEQTRVRYALHVVERAASQIARRFPGRARARELYAIGTFALYRAARDFRDELSHDFADYAYRRVRWAMLDELRALSKHERRARAAWKGGDLFLATYRDDDFNIFKHDTDEEVSRRLQSCVDDLLAATFAAMVEESQRIDAEAEDARRSAGALTAAMTTLTDEQREIVGLVYRDEYTLDGAAKLLGLTYITARRRHADALSRLREALQGAGTPAGVAPPPGSVLN